MHDGTYLNFLGRISLPSILPGNIRKPNASCGMAQELSNKKAYPRLKGRPLPHFVGEDIGRAALLRRSIITCAPTKYTLKKSSLTWGMDASPRYGLGLKSAIAPALPCSLFSQNR